MRGKAFGFGIYLDLHGCHVGKRIDVKPVQSKDPAGDDSQRYNGYQQPFTIEKRYKIIGHGFWLLFAAFALFHQQVIAFCDDLVAGVQALDDLDAVVAF